ncbi:bifunctional non-homologous end joining protein LigD [Roseomonas rosea]|uniref:Bifunctional non-homologous end joining protein LigD n=1 Tax=Muricoccus roseus TaxID=198092 RepID=A0A1M6DKY8_9PROT|nr:non-homologous end-joining DNA ligase [Roseomonas rosea]SHI73638.1 bifunctional non-homologous end joining protein LigD [Roseomonas rosea]
MAEDPLAPYRAKRDFRRTAEPEGAAPKRRKAKALSFVVQKHDATRLHYDFRLELGGVLKSWAVTRGPSLDPAEKRLAVEVEDHPLEYGGFEGTIAEGYGAGTVMLWDRGSWEPESDDPAADLEKGRLRFTLHGERLKGGWHLVRMRPRGRESRTNWLLIKDEDEAAHPGDKDALLAGFTTSVATGRDLNAIAGKQDGPAKPPRKRAAPKKDPESPPAKKRASSSARVTVAGVALTHPDKPLWPEDGITKRDLAEYMEAVAPRLFPWVEGRPLSLLRAPDGINGERFFQRHGGRGVSPLLTQVKPRGEESSLLQVDKPEALVGLAQWGALEIHPWPARSTAITRPDRLILDLDPAEDLPFTAVVEAALVLREGVSAMGLIPFCKTTGGKGLHIVVPVSGASWKTLHDTAARICEALEAEAPDRFTTSSSKAVRGGRIFLDFQRNARGASAVAAWSPRARPGATVSMPLDWAEVREGLDPKAFTLRTAPARLKTADPWQDFEASARPLPKKG